MLDIMPTGVQLSWSFSTSFYRQGLHQLISNIFKFGTILTKNLLKISATA